MPEHAPIYEQPLLGNVSKIGPGSMEVSTGMFISHNVILSKLITVTMLEAIKLLDMLQNR